MELVRELARRQTNKGLVELWAKVQAACEYIAAVAAGDEEGDDVRLRHCNVLLNRVWGMAPQHVDLTVNEPTVWEKAGVTQAVVIRDVIDVDSEEWTNPYDEGRKLPSGYVAAEDEEME